jgi:hypothetical protein
MGALGCRILAAGAGFQEEFDGAIEENKGWYENAVPRGDWREIPKHIANMFYLRSQELVADAAVPGSVFSTPTEFQSKIEEFKQFIEDMRPDLARAIEDANRRFKPVSVPDHIEIIQRLINVMVEAVEYVLSMKPQQAIKDAPGVDAWQLLQRLAANFHESVLALRKHPHAGPVFQIKNEWDCQYLFRSILAAYFRDVRIEEWSPSEAGSSARCEFYLKDHKTMIELKYVRQPSDQNKIKTELARDILDYGKNPSVERLCVLVYDPKQQLPAAVQLEDDLSRPSNGVLEIVVKISPSRGAREPRL